uniref:FAD/NAD(P)-binding domain-containing protein n=1 Tax=Ditylenchus dipsaci TaxID=166011 RepID=A0A915EFC5_9BILA
MITECKKLLRNFSSNDEVVNVEDDLFFFRDERLNIVHELALLQSETLDEAMLKSMCEEHKSNQPEAAKNFKKAVVVGGGPIGLYTAFQLFLAGLHVTLVNDRPHYVRSQVVFLKENWIFELQILLGTAFEKLAFEDPMPEEAVRIAMRTI